MLPQLPVFVLAGGRGERLSGVTDLPKPLIDVGGRPFVTYLLEALSRQGLRRVFFLTGYRAGEFENALQRAVAEDLPDLDITCLPELEPLGTGGALRRAVPYVTESALVLNGDSYCDLDYHALLAVHVAHDGALVLAAAHVENAADFGGLALDPAGRVRGLLEKGVRGPAWINAGAYVLPRAFLEEAIPEGVASLEREILPAWLARQPVWAHRTRGYFCDIGTPERLAQARREIPPSDLSRA